MLATLKPVAFALFAWWFSTGAIIWLDGLPRRTFRWSMTGASLLFAAGLLGIRASAWHADVAAAYQAFGCGLLAWGWQEMSFYMGIVTGPRKVMCEDGCRGWRHFGHAIEASLWHELGLLASGGAILLLCWGAPNQVAVWTFWILYAMHQSAKINVFLGVRNLNEQFLPAHLDFLRSFLNQKPMNLLFPLSISVSTVALTLIGVRAAQHPADSFEGTALLFAASLLGLALVEHWFLMLPLPFAALWNWGLHRRDAPAPFKVDLVAGFLGAGKTTVMRRLLAEADPAERTLVLANDFSSLGIDASLLAGRGAQVIELSNGCICCSLQKDLARQLEALAATHRPQRVLIEPSGVADVAALIIALGKPRLAPWIRSLRVLTLVDAAAFLGDFARMPSYFEAQARVSPLVLVNKTDLVLEGSLDMIRRTLLAMHPGMRIVMARYGMPVDGQNLADILAELPSALLMPRKPAGKARAGADRPASEDGSRDEELDAASSAPARLRVRRVDSDATFGLQSWSAPLAGVCDPGRLRTLLEALAAGRYGRVERVKGIVRADGGWVHFDLAGGRPAICALAAQTDENPRVMAIGRDVDGAGLLQAFLDCTTPGALQHG